MPVVEFAIDLAAEQRIQVHIPTEQTTVTVMVNRSVLGVLARDEQARGKYFVLPDRSNLFVRFDGHQLQVFRNSSLLSPLDDKESMFDASPAAQARTREKRLHLLARIIKGPGRA